MNNKIKQMVYAALLTALAIIIPIQFSFLRVYIPPFSATLAAHVPMFIAMLISPMTAVVVGVGSTLGFLFTGLDIAVVCRAATHILVGFVGAKVIQKSNNYTKAAIITAPIHGLAEALVVIPFVGLDIYQLVIVTGVCGMIHHLIDSVLAGILVQAISKAKRTSFYDTFKCYNN